MAPIHVRLANEYTIRWPLWRADGPADEDEFPVSAELRQRLTAWAAEFNQHYDWEQGAWDSPAIRASHAREAHELQAQLGADLGPAYEVELFLWEC